MITFFHGEIQDVFESEYTKKDTGEVVKQYEVTATFKQRSSNGKLYMFTEHFRFTEDQLGVMVAALKKSIGKTILVPFEKRQFGQSVSISQCRDLPIQILDTAVESKTETVKKAS